VTQAKETATTFAANGEGLYEDVVECFAGLESSTELGCLIPQLLIGHRLVLRLKRSDCFDFRLQPLQEAGVRRAKEAGDAPLESAEDGIADPGKDFPDAFKNFHDELYEGEEPRGSRSRRE